jgi:hypothetical protein
VPVVLFNHSGIGVTEISRDHDLGSTVHHREAGIGVPQAMKANWGSDLGSRTGFHHGASLMRRTPGAAARLREHRLGASAFECEPGE